MKIKALLISLIILLHSSLSFSQVNIEAMRKDISPDEGLSGMFQLSLDSRDGNQRSIMGSGSGLLSLTTGDNLIFLLGEGEYGRFNGKISQNEYFLHMRENYKLYNHTYTDLYFQYESDKFRKLTQRMLLGYGPRVEYDTFITFIYGTGYMVEMNRTDVATHFGRWNNYTTFIWEPTEIIQIINTTYYQPVIFDFYNYRLLNVFTIEFVINKSLRAGVSVTYRFENVPPGKDVESEDFRIKNNLRVVF